MDVSFCHCAKEFLQDAQSGVFMNTPELSLLGFGVGCLLLIWYVTFGRHRLKKHSGCTSEQVNSQLTHGQFVTALWAFYILLMIVMPFIVYGTLMSATGLHGNFVFHTALLFGMSLYEIALPLIVHRRFKAKCAIQPTRASRFLKRILRIHLWSVSLISICFLLYFLAIFSGRAPISA